MISHDNVVFEATAVVEIGQKHMNFCAGEGQERILSYLPLSHIAGLMVDIAFPIVATATTKVSVLTGFARAYDLKMGSLKDWLESLSIKFFRQTPFGARFRLISIVFY